MNNKIIPVNSETSLKKERVPVVIESTIVQWMTPKKAKAKRAKEDKKRNMIITNNTVNITIPSKEKKVEFRFSGGFLQYREIFKNRNSIWYSFARITEEGEFMRIELPVNHPFQDDNGLIAIYDNKIPF